MLRAWLFTSATATLLACDTGSKPAAPPTPGPATAAPSPGLDARPPPPTPTAPTRVAYQHAPGAAYVGVRGAGLYRVEAGKLTRVIAHAFPMKQIAIGPDGAVFAIAIGGIWKLGGRGGPQALDTNDRRGLERIAIGPDGVLWGTDRRRVFRWDGAWTEEPGDTFGGDLINDLAVDRDGRVWVMQSEALWRLDGDHWSKLDAGFGGRKPFWSAIAVDADGGVYVSGLEGTFAWAGGQWRKTELAARYGSIDELVVGPAGHVAGSGGVGSIAVRSPSGDVRNLELSDGPARAHRGDVLAIDGAGRVWITTDNGLVILRSDGTLEQQWLPGTVAGISGAVTAAAVIGDGPALPTLGAVAKGTITGKVLRGGKAVANAAVELCDQPLTIFTRTPCESATASYAARTAADGTFALTDVPVGSYGFAVDPGRQWIILIGGECCSELTAGGSYDVGALTLQ